MTNLRRSLLWVTILALPASLLLLLPLNAQEKSAPAAQAPAQPPAQKPAPTQAPAPAAETAPAPEPAKNDELPPDERVSADNNLSFPVDI